MSRPFRIVALCFVVVMACLPLQYGPDLDGGFDGEPSDGGTKPPLDAGCAPRFEPFAQMTTGRLDFGVSEIPGMGMLVLGGNWETAANLINLSSGETTIPGSSNALRRFNTLTTLSDGRVLVTGAETTAALELFDPATGLFSDVGEFEEIVYLPSATRLFSGCVLIVGGALMGTGTAYSSKAYEWCPQLTPSLRRIQDFPTPIGQHTATLLQDGRVLIGGGFREVYVGVDTAHLYDPGRPAGMRWVPTARPATRRISHSAHLRSDGSVLVIGGFRTDSQSPLRSTELYWPATNSWSSGPSLRFLRLAHASALLPGGEVLVMGGYDQTGNIVTTDELWRPGTDAWVAVGPGLSRAYAQPVLAADGRTFIFGGVTMRDGFLELRDPAVRLLELSKCR